MSEKLLEELIKVLTRNKRFDLIDPLNSWWEEVGDSDYESEDTDEPPEEYTDDACVNEGVVEVEVDEDGFLCLNYDSE
tara:strand:+ start:650 stop:883 length:234 start_codon:yes stop_codon:yes gene_type:complete